MDEKTKNASIEYILSQGLVKPPTTIEKITEMIQNIGFRFIFWDAGYSLFFAVLTIGIVLLLFCFVPNDFLYSASVVVAPLFFVFITMFVETSERFFDLYELKQTCRYTIQQVTALRVICYSFVGFVFTLFIAIISANNVYEFVLLFSISLFALFLCATLNITLLRYFRGKWINVLFCALWVFVNAVMIFLVGEKWESLLRNMPIVLSILLAILGGIVLIYSVSKMLLEGKKYVVA